MSADVQMAEVAALVGDPARANILAALMGGQALTASELAYVAGVSPQTTSGHLGRLTEGCLLSCIKQGRHRYYRIATPRVAEMLEGIMAVVADLPPRHRPLSASDKAMREARTCYDHFAGRLGVGITDALRTRGHLVLADEGGEVTDGGVTFLQALASISMRRAAAGGFFAGRASIGPSGGRIWAAASARRWRNAVSISAGSNARATAVRSKSQPQGGAA